MAGRKEKQMGKSLQNRRIWPTWVIMQRRQWQPTPVLLPGESQGRGSLVGCSPWGREESDTTERLHFPFSLSCAGEGNGNPLQCPCLEDPRAGGAWWAAVCGVAQRRTRLKWLSSGSGGRVIMNLKAEQLIQSRYILHSGPSSFRPTFQHHPAISGVHISSFLNVALESYKNCALPPSVSRYINPLCLWRFSSNGTSSKKHPLIYPQVTWCLSSPFSIFLKKFICTSSVKVSFLPLLQSSLLLPLPRTNCLRHPQRFFQCASFFLH